MLLTTNELLLGITSLILITVAVVKLFPLLRDLKISPEEVDVVKEIITSVITDVINVGTTKSDSELCLVVTRIVTRELNERGINSFSEDTIHMLVNVLIKKVRLEIETKKVDEMIEG